MALFPSLFPLPLLHSTERLQVWEVVDFVSQQLLHSIVIRKSHKDFDNLLRHSFLSRNFRKMGDHQIELPEKSLQHLKAHTKQRIAWQNSEN
jgi:hypothetical protein